MSFRTTLVSPLALAAILFACAAAAGASPRPGWLGIGYVNQVRTENGKVTRSWLLVRHVLPGSPAEKAGLRAGDLITAIDGKPLRHATEAEARAALARIRPKQRLRLSVARLDQRLVLTVVAEPMPDAAWRLYQTNRPR